MGYSREVLTASHHFLFKPIPGVQNGGLHAGVWLPDDSSITQEALPLAMLYHGGGWMFGGWDRVPFNQVRYLLEHGVAVASFEYRHIPNVDLKDIRQDLLDAYQYVQKKLSVDLRDVGSQARIDGAKCVVLGWSAGASDSMWLASDITSHIEQHGPQSLPPLRAIVPTYPLTKLELFAAPQSVLLTWLESIPIIPGAFQKLLAEEVNTRYIVGGDQMAKLQSVLAGSGNPSSEATGGDKDDAAPAPFSPRELVGGGAIATGALSSLLLQQDAPFPPESSPINLIRQGLPPICFVAAMSDGLIPVDHSFDAYSKCQEIGLDSLLVRCEGMQHGEAECLSGSRWLEEWWDQGIRPSLDFAIERLR